MRSTAILLIVLLAAPPTAAEDPARLRAIIIDMAQHFVQERYMTGALEGHYHIEFDVAQLHPQPDPGYWAVVGGFVSDQNPPNDYVSAIRQVCKDYRKVECWRLEKLALNREIVFERGQPL